MIKSRTATCLLALMALTSVTVCSPRTRAEDKESSTFKSKILPVLTKHCYECHSTKAKKSEGGLKLDSKEGRRRGGDRGPAVVPNDVAESILIDALKYSDDDLQMPPNGKLSDEVIEDFVQWIEKGAEQ